MLRLTRTMIGALLVLACALPAGAAAQKVTIVYFTVGGHTELMAEAVARGARSVEGTEVRLLAVEEASVDDVLWADAVILGTPVYNANVAPPIQEFINSWPYDGPMKDKIGAAFVSAGGISLGEESTQLSILRSMLVHRMIVVGGPGSEGALGAAAITGEEPFLDDREEAWVDPAFLEKGEALGRRVAELAGRLGEDGAP
jgi:NAD(P)H dehydrogenase (quinone)